MKFFEVDAPFFVFIGFWVLLHVIVYWKIFEFILGVVILAVIVAVFLSPFILAGDK